MTEPGEGLVGRHYADNHRDQQCQHRDQIVAQPSPDKERKR